MFSVGLDNTGLRGLLFSLWVMAGPAQAADITSAEFVAGFNAAIVKTAPSLKITDADWSCREASCVASTNSYRTTITLQAPKDGVLTEVRLNAAVDNMAYAGNTVDIFIASLAAFEPDIGRSALISTGKRLADAIRSQNFDQFMFGRTSVRLNPLGTLILIDLKRAP